jgi:hypothetical protein
VAGVAQGGGRPPPKGQKIKKVWGGSATARSAVGGVVRPPLKGLETKNKNKKFGFRPPPDRSYGVVETTPRALGVVRPPLKGLETKNKKKSLGFGGGRITPPGPRSAVWGGRIHPPNP